MEATESSGVPPTEPAQEQEPVANTQVNSLKRSRLEAPPSRLASATYSGIPSAKSPRFAGTFIAAPLTGIAAIADEARQREEEESRSRAGAMSKSPAQEVLAHLAGHEAGMSRPQDAPAATTAMSEGMLAAARALSVPSSGLSHFGSQPEIQSPASIASLAGLTGAAQTVTAGSTVIASPAAMSSAIEEEQQRQERMDYSSQLPPPVDEQSANRALSYPGSQMTLQDPRQLPRGMSLPMPGQQLAPRSPSQKKHKCPYCETEFTRHHNLKSHLLTHSQEKPYVCQTCSMRFRRLHDLKRHMKLHTGERPHICPKCDRKFARGDALARHSKGQGGCAGRRASMGSFGGDDDYEVENGRDGEEGMDGVIYSNGVLHANENEMTEEDRRRFSLPSIKAQHVPGSTGSHGNQDIYPPHPRTPSTYPPAGPRTGQLYPPNAEHGGPSSSPHMQSKAGSSAVHQNSTSMPVSNNGVFSQTSMTESPKPLSPAGMHSHQLGSDSSLLGSLNRARSPSLSTQLQQSHFGRRQSEVSGMALPSPLSASHGPKLPALTNLAPPDTRFTLPSQTPGQQNPVNGPGSIQQHHQGQPGQVGQATQATQAGQTGQTGQHVQHVQPSLVSSPQPMFQQLTTAMANRGAFFDSDHQRSGSGDHERNLFADGQRALTTYCTDLEKQNGHLIERIQALESKDRSQEEKISQLTDEVSYLRRQLGGDQQQPATS